MEGLAGTEGDPLDAEVEELVGDGAAVAGGGEALGERGAEGR